MTGDTPMQAGSSRVRLYLMAILAVCLLAIAFVLGISAIRPAEDNMPTILVVLGLLTPITGALMAGAMKENHDAMNSRLTQLLALTAKSSKAEGKLETATGENT